MNVHIEFRSRGQEPDIFTSLMAGNHLSSHFPFQNVEEHLIRTSFRFWELFYKFLKSVFVRKNLHFFLLNAFFAHFCVVEEVWESDKFFLEKFWWFFLVEDYFYQFFKGIDGCEPVIALKVLNIQVYFLFDSLVFILFTHRYYMFGTI